MSRSCEVCGRGTQFGNKITRRGLAKSRGGVGIKTTGISRRTYGVNVQNVRVRTPNGTACRMKVCTKCIRSGKVAKRVD